MSFEGGAQNQNDKSIYSKNKKFENDEIEEFESFDQEFSNQSSNVNQGGPQSYFNVAAFGNHVFSMPPHRQADLFNTLQYSMIALVPLVLLNKVIQKYIPEADDSKSSIEIIMEVFLQLGAMIIGMFFIDRFATFFRTFSKYPYAPHSIFYFMLGFLLIILTIQTKIGEKISILFDRSVALYYGKIMGYKNMDKKQKKNGGAKATGTEGMQILPHPQMISKDGGGDSTSIHQLPVMQQSLGHSGQQATYMQTNPSAGTVQGATMINDGGSFEPMPADSAIGGGFGSSW